MTDTITISPKARLLAAIFELKVAHLAAIESSVGYAGELAVTTERGSYHARLDDHRSYARAIDDAIEVVRNKF